MPIRALSGLRSSLTSSATSQGSAFDYYFPTSATMSFSSSDSDHVLDAWIEAFVGSVLPRIYAEVTAPAGDVSQDSDVDEAGSDDGGAGVLMDEVESFASSQDSNESGLSRARVTSGNQGDVEVQDGAAVSDETAS